MNCPECGAEMQYFVKEKGARTASAKAKRYTKDQILQMKLDPGTIEHRIEHAPTCTCRCRTPARAPGGGPMAEHGEQQAVVPHSFNWRSGTSGVCATCGGGVHDSRHTGDRDGAS